MYEYQERIQRIIWDNEDYWCIDNDKESEELKEVYRKARAFDEIVIETTGAIMNCPPGAVETEAGRLTLDIIEKYDMEDKQHGL
ncbi:MAG: DUF1024 family protein [Staphylococcus equorum]|nr:DUF1024 family protein [Staphylococcus equorum]